MKKSVFNSNNHSQAANSSTNLWLTFVPSFLECMCGFEKVGRLLYLYYISSYVFCSLKCYLKSYYNLAMSVMKDGWTKSWDFAFFVHINSFFKNLGFCLLFICQKLLLFYFWFCPASVTRHLITVNRLF